MRGKRASYCGGNDFSSADGVTFLQFMNRDNHFWQIHFMHFHTLPDFLEKGNRQLAAQMFAEFFDTGQH